MTAPIIDDGSGEPYGFVGAVVDLPPIQRRVNPANSDDERTSS